MPFTEKIKLEAKKKSHFKCCVCQTPFAEVHHIIPEREGGPDTLENAAPLCGGCHQKYGGNPELRKQLREMRDHWWALCSQKAPSTHDKSIYEKLDRVGNDVGQIKSVIIPFLEARLKEIKAADSIDGLSSSFGVLASGTASSIQVACPRCGKPMHYLGGLEYHCKDCDGPVGKVVKLG